jgi:hypothetical protein
MGGGWNWLSIGSVADFGIDFVEQSGSVVGTLIR